MSYFFKRATIVASLWLLSSPIAAEQACIRNHKCVSVQQFDCEPVSRSNIIYQTCYFEPKRYLIVWLGKHEAAYHYCDVPPDVVSEFRNAASMGHYYNTNIISRSTSRKFDCRDHLAPDFE
jgi:KTSC domain